MFYKFLIYFQHFAVSSDKKIIVYATSYYKRMLTYLQ